MHSGKWKSTYGTAVCQGNHVLQVHACMLSLLTRISNVDCMEIASWFFSCDFTCLLLVAFESIHKPPAEIADTNLCPSEDTHTTCVYMCVCVYIYIYIYIYIYAM
jgi:hypothetical protein